MGYVLQKSDLLSFTTSIATETATAIRMVRGVEDRKLSQL